ncbi:MAG: hypothetical protein HYY84_00075 [Deltaproteobacteria bacterium]|nr:hypothetical protein [Deltaproteobacteria bacterium]
MPPVEPRLRRASDLRVDEGHLRTARFYALLVVVMSFLNAWHYMSEPVGVKDASNVLYFFLGGLGLIGLLAFFAHARKVDPSPTELDLDRDEALSTVVASYRVGMRIGFVACLIFLGFSAFRWENEVVDAAQDYKYHLIFWPNVVLMMMAAWLAHRYQSGLARIEFEPLPGTLEETFREMRDSYRKARNAIDDVSTEERSASGAAEIFDEFQVAIDDLYERAARLVRDNRRTVALVNGFPRGALASELEAARAAADTARIDRLAREAEVFQKIEVMAVAVENRLRELSAAIRSAHLAVLEARLAEKNLRVEPLRRSGHACRVLADALEQELTKASESAAKRSGGN